MRVCHFVLSECGLVSTALVVTLRNDAVGKEK